MSEQVRENGCGPIPSRCTKSPALKCLPVVGSLFSLTLE